MDVLADRYELGDPVGAGGMARVVRARDRVLERPVAVKLLRDDIASDAQVRDRFLREARTAAQFNHPNAVAVFDSGADNGEPWIVMELVQGEDLSQRLRRTGPLAPPDVIHIGDCILAALAAAHRQGLVHRDIKPANIMLLDDGAVKLADFGIAKSIQDASSTITATGQIIGTARYLAPEQVGGQSATAASDVYAMGIVLYEMLAGQAPYTGSDPMSVAVAHTREPVPDVAAALPQVSADLAAVITRALAKDPADRFADAGEMRHALLGDTRPQAAGPDAATTAVLPTATAVLPGTTAVLPAAEHAGTRKLGLDDDAPTLDPSFPAPVPPSRSRRRPPWLLLVLVALTLLTIAALVASGVDRAPTEITTEAGVQDDPAQDAGDAELDAPPVDVDAAAPADARGGPAKGKAKGKGKSRGNGKTKGRKD